MSAASSKAQLLSIVDDLNSKLKVAKASLPNAQDHKDALDQLSDLQARYQANEKQWSDALK